MEVVRVGTSEETVESKLLGTGSVEFVVGEEYRESGISD
jgi:hypothetical protein